MRRGRFSSTTGNMRARGTTHRLVLCGAAILAVALAGCGGSSSKPLNKTQLAAKVNALCTASEAAGKKLTPPADFPNNPVTAATFLDATVKLLQGHLNKLKALKPDSTVKSDYTDYTDSVALDLGSIKTAAEKAHAKDQTGLQDLRDEGLHNKDITSKQATALGFTVCVTQ